MAGLQPAERCVGADRDLWPGSAAAAIESHAGAPARALVSTFVRRGSVFPPFIGQIAAERSISCLGADQEIRIAPSDIVKGNQITKLDGVATVGIPSCELRCHSCERFQFRWLMLVKHTSSTPEILVAAGK